MSKEPGNLMYALLEELFPFCRSITGDGVRATIATIQRHLPELGVYEVPSGTKCFDWVIPNEWNIRKAYIETEEGKRVVDFKINNLHVLNYSVPIDKTVGLAELNEHLYSIPNKPDAIPYFTSYYEPRWGFCMSHNDRKRLDEGDYRVVIDSDLKPGSLTYAELIIPGQSEEEILLSTYTCHPSMANDVLSGQVLATFLAKWLLEEKRRYTYRIVFVPETIGAIAYLSKNLKVMKERTIAGFQLTCVGDNRMYSFLPARKSGTLSEKVAMHELKHAVKDFKTYSFLDRGSDERQYCSPGVDLPVVSIMRSKYDEYPEYHTSLDNLSLVTPDGLEGTYSRHINCLQILENNHIYKATNLCEPQLGRYGLRSTIGAGSGKERLPIEGKCLSNFLAYCDGTLDFLEIAESIDAYALDLIPLTEVLLSEGLISILESR